MELNSLTAAMASKCPSCGKGGKLLTILGIVKEYQVECPSCGVRGPRGNDLDMAVKEWNGLTKVCNPDKALRELMSDSIEIMQKVLDKEQD